MVNKMLISINWNSLLTDCLKSMYYSHIYSYLSYGLLVWGPMASKRAIKDLSQIQDACIRLVGKKPKSANVDRLCRELKILRLQDLITLELTKYGHKITHKLYPNTLHKLAEANGGKKTHCYPTQYKQTPNIQ